MDEVTQFQLIVTLERISEESMFPALKSMLAVFSFKIRGFYTDNGSEHINDTVAELLENCVFNSPNRVPDNAMTTVGLKVSTAPLLENSMATRTPLNTMLWNTLS